MTAETAAMTDLRQSLRRLAIAHRILATSARARMLPLTGRSTAHAARLRPWSRSETRRPRTRTAGTAAYSW